LFVCFFMEKKIGAVTSGVSKMSSFQKYKYSVYEITNIFF